MKEKPCTFPPDGCCALPRLGLGRPLNLPQVIKVPTKRYRVKRTYWARESPNERDLAKEIIGPVRAPTFKKIVKSPSVL